MHREVYRAEAPLCLEKGINYPCHSERVKTGSTRPEGTLKGKEE